jgi:hypothetical protein
MKLNAHSAHLLSWVDTDVSLKERQFKVGIDSFVLKCVEYDLIDSANTGKTLNEPFSRVKTKHSNYFCRTKSWFKSTKRTAALMGRN